MAKPKNTKRISEKNKTRGLFDHLKELTEGNDSNYWESLSIGEKVTFQPYMVNRFLSMNTDWIEIVDDLQRYTIGTIPKERVFSLFHEILPKGRVFLRYVKGKTKATIPDELATILMRYFECSEVEMRENYFLLMKSQQGRQFLVELMQGYGMQEKELKKLKKEIDL